jgi:hypothetical protein
MARETNPAGVLNPATGLKASKTGGVAFTTIGATYIPLSSFTVRPCR